MNDRDTFAAAALTGLIANGDYSVESTPLLSYRMAEAMLRERSNHQAALDGSTNHDAAPAARAEESMKEPNGSSTGEPGGEPESTIRTGNKWSPLEHPKPDEILLKAVIGVAWEEDLRQAVVKIGDGKTAWKDLPRLMPLRQERDFDRSKPIENGPDPDSRVWDTPAETNPTPPRHGTPSQCTVQGERSVPGSRSENEPVAWWLQGTEYDTGCEYEYVSLVKESADEAAREGGTVTPLYRSPTLTKKERKAVAFAAKHFGAFKNQAATLRALLERLG